MTNTGNDTVGEGATGGEARGTSIGGQRRARSSVHWVRHLAVWRQRANDDEGAATAEYVIATMAAVS